MLMFAAVLMNVLYELYLLTIASRASVVQIQPEGIILIDIDVIFLLCGCWIIFLRI